MIWYRGTHTDEIISAEIRSTTDQLGPGIYFSSSKDDAATYGKIIHVMTFNGKAIPHRKFPAIASQITKLVKMSDNWKDQAQNWDENPERGVMNFVRSAIQYNDNAPDVFLQAWIDFYRYDSMGYINGMKSLGWDGFVRENINNTGINHLVVYNKDALKKATSLSEKIIKEAGLQEDITLDIDKGDTIKTGKFKNKKVVVKDIDTDEHGLPTVNGKPIMKVRIPKIDPLEKKDLKETQI